MFACFVCDVLCDAVGIVIVVVFVCVGVLLICFLGLFRISGVLVHGVCLCWFVVRRVGFTVFVRFVCDLLCDVV